MCTDVTLVIMACNLDSKSSDENEFSVIGGRIQPYVFEPEYSEEELPRDATLTAEKYLSTGVDKYFAGVKVCVAHKTLDIMQL